MRLEQPPQTLSRGGPSLGPAAAHATRIPAGHPEGYQEAFASLYGDFAEQFHAGEAGRQPDPLALSLPDVEDGARAVKFVTAVLDSAREEGRWTDARLEVA